MSIVRNILRFPFVLWLLIAGGWGYMSHSQWKQDVLEPLQGELTAKQTELEKKKKEVAKGETFKAQRDAKLREIEELGEKSQATAKQLPHSPNIPEVLKALADNADRAGLDFISIKPHEAKAREFIYETPLEVQLKGSYVQIMSFLDATVNLTRVIRIDKMNLSSPTTRGLIASLTTNVTLLSYHVDENLLRGGLPAKKGN